MNCVFQSTFKAVSTRNSAVDLLSLFNISDIPDWLEYILFLASYFSGV